MSDCHSADESPIAIAHALGPKQGLVAIVGPPNAGKTTLFNRLTGLRQKVANFPGVTVEHHLGQAKLPGEDREITLVDHVDRFKKLNATQASAVVLAEKIEAEFLAANDGSPQKAAIVVADVHAAFGAIICHFRPQRIREAIGVSPRAIVSPSARCS